MNLSKRIINEIIDISKKYYGINKVVLFGSRARGDNELKSDIDLAVYCDGDLSLFIEEVENTTHTLLEFDFSDMNNIVDDFFIEQVEKEGIVLYEKCGI
ncbi:nucleotidyltransferase domain-containing protein [uncultured Clostridium sp.]|uniref:nucleotidyltransferase family protein n=1 Tax=Clostridium sp. TaxID=1506 RepID=UPI002597935A|nr:nucleotidyltransferase domain-containing protein [uncultured Clostridium sp.]